MPSTFRLSLIVGALVGLFQLVGTLVVYAFGLHSSPESIEAGLRFENIVSFVVIMLGLSFGLRHARRERHRAGETFGFGAGFRVALACAAAAGLFTALGQYAYQAFINPAYGEHLRAYIIASAKFAPEQAEIAAQQLDIATSARFRGVNQGVSTLLFSLLIGGANALLFRDRPAPQA